MDGQLVSSSFVMVPNKHHINGASFAFRHPNIVLVVISFPETQPTWTNVRKSQFYR